MIISSRNGFSVFLKYTKWAAAAPNCGYSLLVRKCKFSWKVSYRPNALSESCFKVGLECDSSSYSSALCLHTAGSCDALLILNFLLCLLLTPFVHSDQTNVYVCMHQWKRAHVCVRVCVQDVCIMNHRLLPIGATCLQLTSCIDLWNKVNVCDLFWQLLAAPFKKTGLSCDHKEHEFHFFLKRSWGSAIVSTDTKHMHCVFYCQRQARDTHADTHRLVL